MPVPIQIGAEIDISQALQMLTELGDNAGDLSPWFKGWLDRQVTEFYERQFETEGRHGGEPWEPLRPLTVALRSRPGHGFRGPTAILQDTDQMRRDFEHSGGLGLRVIRRDEYRRGVTGGPAHFHQTGWISETVFGRPRRDGPVEVPARPIVPDPMPRSIVSEWEGSLLKFLIWGRKGR